MYCVMTAFLQPLAEPRREHLVYEEAHVS
jgi:hypothetical protein